MGKLIIAIRLLGRKQLQEVVGMFWRLIGSIYRDTITFRLQSPVKVHLVWCERVSLVAAPELCQLRSLRLPRLHKL